MQIKIVILQSSLYIRSEMKMYIYKGGKLETNIVMESNLNFLNRYDDIFRSLQLL